MNAPVLAPPRAAAPARRVPRPYAAELRRGAAPWAAVAMFLMLLGPLVGKASHWQGSWAQTQSELHTITTLLGGPLSVAAGCWQGGREHRRHTDELRASFPRRPVAQFLTASLPVAAGLVAGYLVAAAAALSASWPYTSAGSPQPSALLADALYLVAATVVGHVAGRLLRWRLTAPLLAVCAYVVLGVPSYLTGDARFLGPALQYGAGYELPVWWQPYVMALWTCGLAAAVVLVYAGRGRARMTALLPLAAACAAGVLIVQSADGMWREDPAARREVCAGAAPRICVSAVQSRLLPQVTAALAGINGRLKGVENAPALLDDLSDGARSDDASLPQLFLGESVVRGKLADPEWYAWSAGAMLAIGSCPLNNDVLAMGTVSAVKDWLISNHLSEHIRASQEEITRHMGTAAAVAQDKADRAALDRLRAMDAGKRRVWLGRYLAATQGTCDPSGVPAL